MTDRTDPELEPGWFLASDPPDYVALNRIVDDPLYGSMKDWAALRDCADPDGPWVTECEVEDGHDYEIRMRVLYQSAPSLALVAHNARASVNVPNVLARVIEVNPFIDADNAYPARQWQRLNFRHQERDFTLALVPCSGRWSDHGGNIVDLPDQIVTSSGAPIGPESSGELTGPGPVRGEVTLRVHAAVTKIPNFKVDIRVRPQGTKEWLDTLTASRGERFEVRVGYYNTGEILQNDVVFKMTTEVPFVAGTTLLQNANHREGVPVATDDMFRPNGINIGNYMPGAKAYVFADLQLEADAELGETSLWGIVRTENGAKESGTAVTVVE